MRMRVGALALLSGLRIQCCGELWCTSQSSSDLGVSVAYASCYSSNSTPWLGTLIWLQKDKKKKSLLYRSASEKPNQMMFMKHLEQLEAKPSVQYMVTALTTTIIYIKTLNGVKRKMVKYFLMRKKGEKGVIKSTTTKILQLILWTHRWYDGFLY